MFKWICYFLLFVIFGVVIIMFPSIIDYTNTGSWFFDLSKFLNDYPYLRISTGIVFIGLGVIGLVITAFLNNRKNTAFVIFQSGEGDYGNLSLSYPKRIIGNQEPIFYENVASLKVNSRSILELDKKRISRFFDRLRDKKKIAFLGVGLFPFIVYAGFKVGNAGQKVVYYHYNRQSGKSQLVRTGISVNHSFQIEDCSTSDDNKKELTIAVSVSYQVDKQYVLNQFSNTDIIFLKSLETGTEVVTNKKTLEYMADCVRETIGSKSKHHNVVNLLLSCPSELCFAIGCRLSSPGLPLVRVYNFNKKSHTNKWDWFIDLDK